MRPPTKPLRGVVFDLDGLIFNTEELYQEVGRELLARRGHVCSAELLDEMMGRPGRVSFEIMIRWHSLSDSVETLAQESAEIFNEILPSRLAPMPGFLQLLRRLETHDVPRGIATSSGIRFVRQVLSQFDLEPRFGFLLTAEDVMEGKPHPEIYEKAAARLGLVPEEVMVLEDSQNGCRAAVAAGTYAVAVPAGHSLRHDFHGAALVAQGLADPRIFAALALGHPDEPA